MTPKPYHCRHIFTDGHQCGSPALHGEPLCYYHHASRRPDQLRTIAGDALIALPEPTDLHAVQRGLAELLRLAATGHIEESKSRHLLRILATASSNLARIDRQTARALKADPTRTPVQDYTLDPQRGTLAPAPLVYDQSGQNAQPAQPEPRPEGPLPDPVTRLTLKPNIELVKDPLLEAFKQEQAAKLYREAEAVSAANTAARQARPHAQREAERQRSRNRHPEATRHIFDEVWPPEPDLQTTNSQQPTTQSYPQPNQDFGLLENTAASERTEHLACA